MHLVFLDYQESKGEFKIHEANKPAECQTEALEFFQRDEEIKHLMQEYTITRNIEKEMAKKRKEILINLKSKFKDDLVNFEEEHPEFFI